MQDLIRTFIFMWVIILLLPLTIMLFNGGFTNSQQDVIEVQIDE